jgi:hypothetical protein
MTFFYWWAWLQVRWFTLRHSRRQKRDDNARNEMGGMG